MLLSALKDSCYCIRDLFGGKPIIQMGCEEKIKAARSVDSLSSFDV